MRRLAIAGLLVVAAMTPAWIPSGDGAAASPRIGPPECVAQEMRVTYGGTAVSEVADGAGQTFTHFYFTSTDNCQMTNWYPHIQLVSGAHRDPIGYGTPRRKGNEPVFIMLHGVRLVSVLTKEWGVGGFNCHEVSATGAEIFGAFRSTKGHSYVFVKLSMPLGACVNQPNGRASPFRKVAPIRVAPRPF